MCGWDIDLDIQQLRCRMISLLGLRLRRVFLFLLFRRRSFLGLHLLVRELGDSRLSVQKRGVGGMGGSGASGGQCKSQGVGGSWGEKLASPANILIAIVQYLLISSTCTPILGYSSVSG
jgi:hypothetical protein